MILLSSPYTYRHSILIILVAAELRHHHAYSSGRPTTILFWTHKWAKEVVIADDCMR